LGVGIKEPRPLRFTLSSGDRQVSFYSLISKPCSIATSSR